MLSYYLLFQINIGILQAPLHEISSSALHQIAYISLHSLLLLCNVSFVRVETRPDRCLCRRYEDQIKLFDSTEIKISGYWIVRSREDSHG